MQVQNRDRFHIDQLEDRIAPVTVSQALGNSSGQVTGSADIEASAGGASGTISVATPGTTVDITIGEGPA